MKQTPNPKTQTPIRPEYAAALGFGIWNFEFEGPHA
jgi:hypothetical protein